MFSSGGAPPAHALEARAMAGEDVLPRLLVHVRLPDAALERAAEQDAVAPREHVERAADHDVVHLRLGQQERELALDGQDLLVAEEGLRSEAGAVDDDGLGERLHLLAAAELAHDDPASCEAHVALHRGEVRRRLHEHRREAASVALRERMLVWPELTRLRIEVADE